MRTLLRALAGLVFGYLIYLPFLLGVEYLFFHRLDGEKVFYGLYSPFEAPFLLAPSTWRTSRVEELVLESIGGILLIGGVVVALRMGRGMQVRFRGPFV
jgi:hypothetical protein